jgi:hypothetical protein
MSLIVWHDTLSGAANEVECLSYETKHDTAAPPPLAAADFVVIEDDEQGSKWMGQVVEPQRNVPLQGLSRDSPSEVAVLERVLHGEISKTIFLNQVYYYRVQLIGEILSNGRLTAVRRRPRAGSIGQAATAADVRKALDLPAIEGDNIVGRIHSTDIPIAVDWAALRQHVLVAGATGAGKSNTVANLIKVAQSYRACVVIFDQKPDYQAMPNANDEVHLFEKWEGTELPLTPKGLQNVRRYALWHGEDDREQGETPITVRARDLSLGMLVSALFPYPDEGNQRDTFQALLSYYGDNKNKEWTLLSFSKWLIQARDKKGGQTSQLDTIARSNGWGALNDMTLDAMQRKMMQRCPRWVDSMDKEETSNGTRGGLLDRHRQQREAGAPKGYYLPKEHLAEGRIVVIRTNAEGREYGLFLSYMLQQIFDLRRQGKIAFPIVNIVDEAQDIFQGDAGVRDSATAKLNEIIRKGRSKDIGFVIAVQSVSQVPASVLTNMNTRFIHRQNSLDELRTAIPSASRDLMATSLTFGPGEALVSIIGARSVVQGEMAPSPFELSKTSSVKRKTLGDQDVEAMVSDDGMSDLPDY